MKISLCLLTWNELEGCQIDVPNIPITEFDEIFCIDGGSTDGTREYLESNGIPVILQNQRGLNAAYRHAAEVFTGDALVVFFPKGTIATSSLKEFRPRFESGFELVVASRQIPGSRNEEDVGWWRPRKFAVFLLSLFAALLWRREGWRIRDVLHGYKGFSRDAFKRINILPYGLSVDIEMVIRSYKFKISRTEFPVAEFSRTYGKSHFPFWKTSFRIIAFVFNEMKRKD